MARVSVLVWLATLIARASGLMQFINPPPSGKEYDLSNSNTYTQGSTVNVLWTPAEAGKAASLVLYQCDNTGQWYGDMEYLTQGAVGVTKYGWLVGTRKNITESNVFFMSIFQEGTPDADANSHYFYIQDDRRVQQPSALATPSPSSTSIATSSASSIFVASSTALSSQSSEALKPPPSSSPTPASTPSGPAEAALSITPSNGFPMAAKVGIGAGIPAALAIGLGVGFLMFRRRKKRDTTFKAEAVDASSPYSPNPSRYQSKGAFYGSNMNEAPPQSPVEMGPRRGESYYPQHVDSGHHTERSPQRPQTMTMRYEM